MTIKIQHHAHKHYITYLQVLDHKGAVTLSGGGALDLPHEVSVIYMEAHGMNAHSTLHMIVCLSRPHPHAFALSHIHTHITFQPTFRVVHKTLSRMVRAVLWTSLMRLVSIA